MELEFSIRPKSCDNPNQFGFVVVDTQGQEVGYVDGQTNPANTNTADLMDIFVQEKYRRQGYGSALLSHFALEAKSRGARIVDVEVIPNRGSDYDTTAYFYTSNGAFMNSRNKAIIDLSTEDLWEE